MPWNYAEAAVTKRTRIPNYTTLIFRQVVLKVASSSAGAFLILHAAVRRAESGNPKHVQMCSWRIFSPGCRYPQGPAATSSQPTLRVLDIL